MRFFIVPAILLVLLLSLPSFAFVWLNRDVPHFGVLQDDGLYFIGGKALAEGTGYRILSFPGQPFQTKYPPLYPLYLSIAWRLNPAFPANLPIALILSWLALPVVLVLFHRWLQQNGFTMGTALLITGLLALNPYVLFFVSNLGSELFFMVFLFAAMFFAEKTDRSYSALIAGVLAGAGYLARTAGIALLPAAIIYFIWIKQPRRALWFTLGMIPAVAAWTLWTRTHAAPGHDPLTLCYTNYVGYQFYNVGWDNFASVLWQNASDLLVAMGSLIFPQMLAGLPEKLLLPPLAIAMILGGVRLVRNGHARLYAIFGTISLLMLVLWHFPPNQRFILPVAPLLLACFWTEAVHFAGLVRKAFSHPDPSQRRVAYGFAGFLIAILVTGAGLQIYMWVSVIPGLMREDRKDARAFEPTFNWVRANTPDHDNVLWENDTAFYLETGRRGAAFLIPTRHSYAKGDDDLDLYQQIDQYAREHSLAYVILPKEGPHNREDVLRSAARNPGLMKIHDEPGAVVYRVQ